MIKGHGGNIYDLALRLGCDPAEIIDMSSNVNPFGPPPGLVALLQENMSTITALPEVDSGVLIRFFAERYDVDPDRILAGNGSTQFIYAIPQALESKRSLILAPTYADYADACKMYNLQYENFYTLELQGFRADLERVKEQLKDVDTVFICNPNNPTGVLYSAADIESLCHTSPQIRFIIDESYLPFVNGGEQESLIGRNLPNVIVLNSMSKIFRISGLRIGFLIAPHSIIKKFKRYMLPWSVNSLAQVAVRYLMTNRAVVDAFIEQSRKLLDSERRRFAEALQDISNLFVFPSTTSFMLLKLLSRHTADTICDHLSDQGILIRNCSNFKGLSNQFIRMSMKTSEINRMLAEKLSDLMSD